MNVLHSISGMGVKSGGPSLSTYLLVKGLRECGVDATIMTYGSEGQDSPAVADAPFIRAIPPPAFRRWGWSGAVHAFLLREEGADLFHVHGIWQYMGHATARHAQLTGKPYLVSTRGMLYPEALKKSGLIKRVALSLYQRKDLLRAACVHATCEQEYRFIRACGIPVPVAVIPNPVELGDMRAAPPQTQARKRVGFIGRFAPIKNIESLIEAWAQVGSACSDWELVLVGDGDAEYARSLSRLAERLSVGNILFAGFLSGQAKDEMLASFRFLVLPSKSENFGMVVPEALCRHIPVIASKGTPWQALLGDDSAGLSGGVGPSHSLADAIASAGRCGWWADAGAAPLAAALREALALPEALRQKMGKNGSRLISTTCACPAVAAEMKKVYEWALGAGPTPECIRLS